MTEFEDPESNSSSEMDEYESDDELGDSFAVHSKPTNRSAGKSVGRESNGSKSSTRKGGKQAPSCLEVRDYMDLMDRELSRTAVGQSFVREGDEYDEVG